MKLRLFVVAVLMLICSGCVPYYYSDPYYYNYYPYYYNSYPYYYNYYGYGPYYYPYRRPGVYADPWVFFYPNLYLDFSFHGYHHHGGWHH